MANSENLEILQKDESFGRTKLCIYDADDIKKVRNCKKYLSTKFTKAINMMTPDKFLYYLPDFNTICDSINWNGSIKEIDKQLYNKYKLTKEEIKFIESMIKPME